MKISMVAMAFLAVTGVANASGITVESCPTAPWVVTPNTSLWCGGEAFNFGSDPLPDGGSLIIRSITLYDNPWPQWNIDFGFTNPSARTTVLDYTATGLGSFFPGLIGGADFVGLGMRNSPFIGGFYPPNETGSNFTITVSGDVSLQIVNGGNATSVIAPGADPQSLVIETSITDRAGNLTGFDEAFLAPEPAKWGLSALGLLTVFASLGTKSKTSK